MLDKTRPVYTIGTAAELLGVHPRTLRLYEDGGLLRPARKNNRRYYSDSDLEWIQCVRYLLHSKGLNQEGVRRLLSLIPCWNIKGCTEERKASCSAPSDRTSPCWDIARRSSENGRLCHECCVYVGARNHIMSEAEWTHALRG